MLKSDLIKRVELVNLSDKSLKDAILGWIDISYDAGFAEGMKAATSAQKFVFDSIFPKLPEVRS